MSDKGQLVPFPAGAKQVLSGDVQGSGDDIGIIDWPSDKLRWHLYGEARDRNKPQFANWDLDPVRPADNVLWVSSFSWNGGGPKLVKMDAATGRILGCQPTPAGAPWVRFLRSMTTNYLITGAWKGDDAPAEGAFTLVVPDPKPTCKKPAGS